MGEHIEADWVDSLLVDDDESFVGSIAELFLKIDNFLASLISESSLRGLQFFSLFSAGVEELTVDLSLFVLQGDIASQDIAVVEFGWHVGVSGSVIQDESSDESGIGSEFMDHMHDFDHVQVDWGIWDLDDFNSIN